MRRRGALRALALVAALLGSSACGDEEDSDGEDAGASGEGGQSTDGGRGARGGTGGTGSGGRGGAGSGGRPGQCTPKHEELAQWCESATAACQLSEQERLDDLCESWQLCGGGSTCVSIQRGSNSCGGSSILATYNVDAGSVTHHYDADGELVGVVSYYNRCSGGLTNTYGEECEVSGTMRHACPADADADAGL